MDHGPFEQWITTKVRRLNVLCYSTQPRKKKSSDKNSFINKKKNYDNDMVRFM